MTREKSALAFLTFCALLSAASPLRALSPSEENRIAVFKKAAPSVVFVTNIAVGQDFFMDEFAIPQGAGSGFIWDTDGHIVTNYHVVEGGDAFLVKLNDGTELQAALVGIEPRKDIAVLKVSKRLEKMRPIALGDSEHLQVGQDVLAIGNPFGLDNTLTSGIVSALGRRVMGIGGVSIHDMIQTDAAINPGNSGGPLLDSSGRLIGMNTMIYSNSGSNAGVGFAVPEVYIKKIVPQIIRYGKAVQPGIGVEVLNADQQYRLVGDIKGVVIRRVLPRTPAAEAGMRGIHRSAQTGTLSLGDIIVSVDRMPVDDYDDLYNVFDRHNVGDLVRIGTIRDGTKRVYRIKLADVF